MSLIMDALEKVQRETKPLAAAAALAVLDQPKPDFFTMPREEPVGTHEEQSPPIQRNTLYFIFLFAGLLFAAAIMGFGKISAGLALPQTMDVQAPIVLAAAKQAVHPSEGPGILRGVLQDSAGSFCILGEQILKTGDTWRGYTVLSIEAQQVVVQDTQNRLLTLHLQES